MTPHQFRTARIALGFSIEEAALWLGKVPTSEWRTFEIGEKPIPTEISRQLVRLIRYHRMAIDEMLRRTKETMQTLIWFDCVEDWRLVGNRFDFLWRPTQMVARTAATLAPSKVILVPFREDRFIEWLKKQPEKSKQTTINHDDAVRWAEEEASAARVIPSVGS